MQDDRKRHGTLNNLMAELTSDTGLISVNDAQATVPAMSGLYAIFVDAAGSLPSPFNSHLLHKQTRLIYIGKADNLRKRLVADDLRHKGPSTFFRGIGAILGYTPPKGSLAGKSNHNNYRFSLEDTTNIVGWIDPHLSVKWQTLGRDDVKIWETHAIKVYGPLLNTQGNPAALPELAALRKRCREIALSD